MGPFSAFPIFSIFDSLVSRKTADCKAKQIGIWASGLRNQCTKGTFDI